MWRVGLCFVMKTNTESAKTLSFLPLMSQRRPDFFFLLIFTGSATTAAEFLLIMQKNAPVVTCLCRDCVIGRTWAEKCPFGYLGTLFFTVFFLCSDKNGI